MMVGVLMGQGLSYEQALATTAAVVNMQISQGVTLKTYLAGVMFRHYSGDEPYTDIDRAIRRFSRWIR